MNFRIMKKYFVLFVLTVSLFLLTGCVKPAEDPGTDEPVVIIKDNTDNEQVAEEIPEIPAEEDETDNNEEETDIPGPGNSEEKDPEEDPGEEELPEPDTEGISDGSGIVHVTDIRLDRYQTELEIGQVDMAWTTFYPYNASNKGEIWSSDVPGVASVDGYGRITAVSAGECTVTVRAAGDPEISTSIKVTVTPSSAPSSPTYIDGMMIANKSYPLPASYNPGEDPEAVSALQTMIAAASNDGIQLFKVSGFRSYETQQGLYARYLLREGRDAADRYSARPGYSEHQTGLAFDLNSVETSFGETAEGKWLASHCMEYGFIIRYPEGKEDITGYMYEPWHVRYLGTENAKAVSESGLTLEEYLGITSVYPN